MLLRRSQQKTLDMHLHVRTLVKTSHLVDLQLVATVGLTFDLHDRREKPSTIRITCARPRVARATESRSRVKNLNLLLLMLLKHWNRVQNTWHWQKPCSDMHGMRG